MSDKYKFQLIKNYLKFHVKDSRELKDLLDYLDKLQQEIKRLNNIINESAEEILKELEKNHHLSYGTALAIRQKLLDYKELKGSDKE